MQGLPRPDLTNPLSSSLSATTAHGFETPARAMLGHLLYFLIDARMRATDVSEGDGKVQVWKHWFWSLCSFCKEIVMEVALLSCSKTWAAVGLVHEGSGPQSGSPSINGTCNWFCGEVKKMHPATLCIKKGLFSCTQSSLCYHSECLPSQYKQKRGVFIDGVNRYTSLQRNQFG